MNTRTVNRIAAAGIIGATVAGTLALTMNSAGAGHLNTVLSAELRGRNEVPTAGSSQRNVGDRNGKGEAYVFGIDNDPITLCYLLEAEKIDSTFVAGVTGMAHIHRGAKGQNGPVVANLAFPVGGDAADCLTEGEAGKFPRIGLAGEPASIVADILEHPGNYYINVHTGEHPSGAIRGQLSGYDH